MSSHSYFRLFMDGNKSKTDGSYEYYYTYSLPTKFEGRVKNIALKFPNAVSGDEIEIFLKSGNKNLLISYNKQDKWGYGRTISCNIDIHENEVIGLKLTGSAVDSDVDIIAYVEKIEKGKEG